MKSVDIEALRQQLEIARNGNRDEQKAFLSKIVSPHNEEMFINEMDKKDLEWIKPLALELFTPAVEVLVSGMSKKFYYWEELFRDADTGGEIPVLQYEPIENETVFDRDEDLLEQISKKVIASLSAFSIEDLKRLQYCGISKDAHDAIEEELYRRDDPDAIRDRGDRYRFGDEENGIFIDYEKAKTYYDRAGVAFDPEETDCKARYDAQHIDCPEFVTYHITGDDVPVVKTLLKELFNKFGEIYEPRMYLPLEVVMKALVGSDAYVGYIQSIDEETPTNIEVEFYEARIECLKYALLQVFPDLKIEITKHD